MPTDYNSKRDNSKGVDNKSKEKRYVNQPQHHGWEELAPEMKNFWSDFSTLAYEKTGRYPRFTSGKRTPEQKVGNAHETSKHNEGKAIDIAADYEMFNILYNTPDGLGILNRYNLGVLDETSKAAMAKTGATGPHYHIGVDPALVSRASQRYNTYKETGNLQMIGLDRDITDTEFKIYAPATQQLEEDIAVEIEKEKKKEEKEEKSESRKKVSPNKEKSFFADIKLEQQKQEKYEPFQDTPQTKVQDILSDYSSISSDVQTKLPNIPNLFREITTKDLDKMQDGGEIISSYGWDYKKDGEKYLTRKTGSENWIEATGEPLKAIKQKIYNEIPYTKEDKQSDYVKNVKQLIDKGYTLDNLVEKRIGTKEGLLNLFPELSSNKKEAEKSKEGEVRFKPSNRSFENKISNDILDVDTRLKFEINLDNIKERVKLDLKNRSSNLTQNETSEQYIPKREYEISPENLVEATRQFNEEAKSVSKTSSSLEKIIEEDSFKNKVDKIKSNLSEEQKEAFSALVNSTKNAIFKYSKEIPILKDIVGDINITKNIPDYSRFVKSPTADNFREDIIEPEYKYGMSTDDLLREKGYLGKGIGADPFIDCSGAVCKVMTSLGKDLGSPLNTNAQKIHDKTKEIKNSKDWKDGDIITFKTDSNKVDHVGFLVIDENSGEKFIAESSRSFQEGRIVPFEQRLDFLYDVYPDMKYYVRRFDK